MFNFSFLAALYGLDSGIKGSFPKMVWSKKAIRSYTTPLPWDKFISRLTQ